MNTILAYNLIKSLLFLKLVKSIFLGSSLFIGLITQRIIYFYRKLIVKEIYISKINPDNKLIYIILINNRIISDFVENIKFTYSDNDYNSPNYIITNEDLYKVSYFVNIKNEEFYIPRKLVKIKNAENFNFLLNGKAI